MLIKNTVETHQQNIKLVIYGASGSGKTSSIKTLPHDKTLVISAESGLLALVGTKIDYVDISVDDKGQVLSSEGRIKRLEEVMKFLNTDEAKKKYDNIVVDSLTEVGECIATYWKEKIKDKSKMFEMWGSIAIDQIKFIKECRDLPHYNVVFICLEDLAVDETSTRYYQCELPGNSAKNFIGPAFDLILRLTVERNGNRFFQTQPLSNVKAKDRSGRLAPQEPIDLGLIFKKILGEKNEEKKPDGEPVKK